MKTKKTKKVKNLFKIKFSRVKPVMFKISKKEIGLFSKIKVRRFSILYNVPIEIINYDRGMRVQYRPEREFL